MAYLLREKTYFFQGLPQRSPFPHGERRALEERSAPWGQVRTVREKYQAHSASVNADPFPTISQCSDGWGWERTRGGSPGTVLIAPDRRGYGGEVGLQRDGCSISDEFFGSRPISVESDTRVSLSEPSILSGGKRRMGGFPHRTARRTRSTCWGNKLSALSRQL